MQDLNECLIDKGGAFFFIRSFLAVFVEKGKFLSELANQGSDTGLALFIVSA